MINIPKDFISVVQDFITGYGAKEDYTVKEVNGLKVICFSNPGWSINRTSMIYQELYEHLISSDIVDNSLLDNIRIIFE